jgi:hypothetical protein
MLRWLRCYQHEYPGYVVFVVQHLVIPGSTVRALPTQVQSWYFSAFGIVVVLPLRTFLIIWWASLLSSGQLNHKAGSVLLLYISCISYWVCWLISLLPCVGKGKAKLEEQWGGTRHDCTYRGSATWRVSVY